MTGAGLTARIRGTGGWPVPHAVLTVTDTSGRQLARAVADDTGAIATDPLPPGVHTVVLTAAGYRPAARAVQISAVGAAAMGDLALTAVPEAVTVPSAGTWTIDPAHSSVLVTARHLGISSITARFGTVGGRLEVAPVFEESRGRAEIDAADIDTGIAMRDTHLRSADFLDVGNYPLITYTGAGLRRTGADTWVMAGELMLHGQRRPVELDLTYGGSGADPWGGVRAAFHAETLLRRADFAIDYNAVVRAGVAAVGTTVKVDLDIQVVQGDRLPRQ